ncbi:efflux RND transporter periplasmic adaptor subunit [Pseudovibrio exalbescens]|uniref:efflux RND transporter periplasmic adaptor subunit n=1 Tax=Pseudovibrio exalbescens TaxID=197461 RepID=UPI0023658763|nr:efflux RND transporter periplasmic adaptor subunit [Pseudovibrio exalbescens]MDD7911548.1 efflux RND transporter periplasmic adaptor subunit [Pseudovibrio exalbescens]
MFRWIAGMLVIALLAFGTVIGFNYYVAEKTKEALANAPEPTFPVSVQKLEPKVWPQTIQVVGFVEANQGVYVSSEVSGTVTDINFENGDTVKAGDVLVSLDSSVQRAELKVQEVQLPSVEANYNRQLTLFRDQTVSEKAMQDAQSNFEALKARIGTLQTEIAQREIKAPFSGKLGIRSIDLGQYVHAGDNFVRLEDLSVMRVRFSIEQADLSKISLGQEVNLTVVSYPGRVYVGKINAIEPIVSGSTGLVTVQATVPNDDRSLRGGMFASVQVREKDLDKQFVVPQTAIVFALYGDSVFVQETNEDKPRARQVTIKVLQRNGSDALVTGDLKFGDAVVTSGAQNLSNNAAIKVVPDRVTPPATMPRL